MSTTSLNGNETITRVSPFSFSTGAEPAGVVIDTTYFIQDSRRLARLKEERGDAVHLFTTDAVIAEIAEIEQKMSQQRNPKIPWKAFRNVTDLLGAQVVERISSLEASCSEGSVISQEHDLLKKLQRGLEKTLYIEELEREKAALIARTEHIAQLANDYLIMRVAVHRYLERTELTTGASDLDEACNRLRQDLVACYRQARKRMGERFQEIHYSINGSFAYAPYLERRNQQQRDLVGFLNAGLVQTLFRVVLDDELRKDFSFYNRLEKNSIVDRGVLLAAYTTVPAIISDGPIAIATHDNDIISLIELRQRTTLRYINGVPFSPGAQQ